MSADLFAEFSNPSPNQQQQAAAPASGAQQTASDFNFFNALNNTSAPLAPSQGSWPQQQSANFESNTNQAVVNDDNDDWGDFEGGASTESAPVTQDPFAFTSSQASKPPQSTWNTSSALHDPFAFQAQPSTQPIEQDWQRAPIVKAKKSANPSVLFDAEDDLEDDDDFGDFEGVQESAVAPTAPSASSSALVDLLGDMSVSEPQHPLTTTRDQKSASRSSRVQASTKKPSGPGFGAASRSKQPSPVPAPTAQKDDDSWDTFDDWEASIPTKPSAKMSGDQESTKTRAKAKTPAPPATLLSPRIDEPQPGELPPTNVPPPGVLLSLFPTLFAEAQEKLFKPMAAQALPMRNKLLAERSTISYLQGYLILANVAAHVIAGRKLRWKRDQHLSQGMRIGPASSRATSGMKLTGIDKGENRKEEREVSDVVRHWKEQVGRLRHVVSGANQIKADNLGSVPDLQESMPVKILKQSEGGVPARQPCMMCGLKRDERVTAADMATDDSFGEWWIDQVNMHRGCRNFWHEHKAQLRSG